MRKNNRAISHVSATRKGSFRNTFTATGAWPGQPLRKGELPQVSEALCTRLAWSINMEVAGFASIPLLAALMAHGVGLGG